MSKFLIDLFEKFGKNICASHKIVVVVVVVVVVRKRRNNLEISKFNVKYQQ